jgi:hypothetical protein
MHDTLCISSSLLYDVYLANSMACSHGVLMIVCYVFSYNVVTSLADLIHGLLKVT